MMKFHLRLVVATLAFAVLCISPFLGFFTSFDPIIELNVDFEKDYMTEKVTQQLIHKRLLKNEVHSENSEKNTEDSEKSLNRLIAKLKSYDDADIEFTTFVQNNVETTVSTLSINESNTELLKLHQNDSSYYSLFAALNATKKRYRRIREAYYRIERKNSTIPIQDDIECSPEKYMRRFPTALIIGEKKCGTSPVLKFLYSLNPKIKAPADEMHFFDVSRRRANIGVVKRYQGRMPPSCPGDVTMEKTPNYFRSRMAPKRVKKFNPDFKLILALRDPIDRALSEYNFEVRRFQQGYDVEDWYGLYTFEQLAINSTTGLVNASFEPLVNSMYEVKMEHWLSYFPLKQFHIVDADNFDTKPVEELNKIEKFLDLEPKIKTDMLVFNITKGYFCMRDIPCTGNQTGHIYEPLDPTIRKRLTGFFKPHVQKLNHMVHVRLSWMRKYLETYKANISAT